MSRKKFVNNWSEAGFTKSEFTRPSDLDEKTILNLKVQGAKIDVWGIGTRLILA